MDTRTVSSGRVVPAMPPVEIPSVVEKLLQVKVMWGPVVLGASTLREGESFTVGDHPGASMRTRDPGLAGQLFPLVSPGGIRGHVVSAGSNMQLSVSGKDSHGPGDKAPRPGQVLSHALVVGERCRITFGQLVFVIEYTAPARGVRSRRFAGSDLGLYRWLAVSLVLACGLWALLQLTPPSRAQAAGYITNPQRFASIAPFVQDRSERHFAEVEKNTPQQARKNRDTEFEKQVTGRQRHRLAADNDYEKKTSGSVVDLLRSRSNGPGGGSGNVLGGTDMHDLDSVLASLPAPGGPDGAGMGSIRPGGGPGLGGEPLNVGGKGPWGRDSENSTMDLLYRGAGSAKIEKPKRPPSRVEGGLSQAVVGNYIARYWSQFKYCYEQGLGVDPNLFGKVTVNFVIGPDGRVREAAVLQSSMDNTDVEQCLLRTVRRMRFPRPRGGGEVIVTYPFLFTTAG